MKFTIERSPFAKALAHVGRVVERRNTYPILANVLIRAEDGAIHLRATDLDIEITQPVAATVHDAGVTTVPASMLAEIVRKMPDGAEITFDEKDGMAKVSSGRSRFNLACLDADSFPDLKSAAFTHTFNVAAKDLKRIISKSQFAISNEETRYYLNGIYLHAVQAGNQHFLRGVATDGHRMARCQVDCPKEAIGMAGIIIPRKTVGEFTKLLDTVEGDGTVQLEVSDSKIRMTAGNIVILSKLIEGTFPDYERVTPKNNEKVVAVPKTELANATGRVSIVASERGGKAVKLKFEEMVLTLEVSNPDHGTATEEVTVDSDLDSFEIGFNANYLMTVVDQIDAENVQFCFNDAGSPTLIKDPADESFQFVLMPMRV